MREAIANMSLRAFGAIFPSVSGGRKNSGDYRSSQSTEVHSG